MKTFMTESNDFKPNLSFNRDSFGLLSTKSSSTFTFDKVSKCSRMFHTSSPNNSIFYDSLHEPMHYDYIPWYNSSSQHDDSSSRN
jgi:hypothetical protein